MIDARWRITHEPSKALGRPSLGTPQIKGEWHKRELGIAWNKVSTTTTK